MNLLPLNTRVLHFGGGEGTHGAGTIIEYNGTPVNTYAKERLIDAIDIANKVGCLGALLESFYDKDRCPYVVQWDNGYKDVYEPESLVVKPDDSETLWLAAVALDRADPSDIDRLTKAADRAIMISREEARKAE